MSQAQPMMSTSPPTTRDEGAATPSMPFVRVWALHLLCLTVPLLTLAFLLTGPHPGLGAGPWIIIIPALVALDLRSGAAKHAPVMGPSWPFDLVLVLLVALQGLNIALTGRLVSMSGLWSLDALVAALLVGANSAYSAIVVAHELIHRKSRAMQLLGRLLLVTVGYDHFYVEHIRGHHARVGTSDDPATARYGETFSAFWRRTVPGQFKSAWRIEAKRLGDEDMRFYDLRALRSEVTHGVIAEVLLAVLMLVAFGPGALVVFFAQALVAVRFLEAVNYFEHYGLVRVGKKVRPVDSWDSDSWLTLFSLVGLSRHADHHAYASRPYQSLRAWEESPKLPCGYLAMVFLVMFADGRARALLDKELARKKLGPYAAAA